MLAMESYWHSDAGGRHRSVESAARSNVNISIREDALKEKGRPLLICFSHLRWDFVFQRPQQLLTRAAYEYEVFFIEEPIFVADATAAYVVTTEKHGVHVVVPTLPRQDEAVAEKSLRSLVDQFLEGFEKGRTRVFWYYTPMALSFSSHHQASVTVYDNMDELSAFRGASPKMLENEQALLSRADVVFSGGASLYEAKCAKHPNVHLFPSSVDANHFREARLRPAPEPDDQAKIASPRLGYFGVVDERIDLELIDVVAAMRPGWQVVMVGPVVKINPATLPRRSNIHWLGIKAYDDLPQYMGGWDVGIMPFALNESTRYISPTKTPEFLAAGLPLVSTAIRDVVEPYGVEGFVQIARSPAEFITQCEARLGGLGEHEIKRIDEKLSGGSWDGTWFEMSRIIAQIAAGHEVVLNRFANV
jgi:glycosyltransferase involved in cell wall biosynthesis